MTIEYKVIVTLSDKDVPFPVSVKLAGADNGGYDICTLNGKGIRAPLQDMITKLESDFYRVVRKEQKLADPEVATGSTQ